MNLPNRPIVGFTGTRAGMTAAQAETVRRLLRELRPAEFHHGDCVGADEQAHALAMRAGVRVIIHPPEYGRHRAWCLGAAAVLDVKPYMERNADIVAACSILIATPQQAGEIVRSGTWATVRRGRKADRLLHVVAPDGTVGDGRPVPGAVPKSEKRAGFTAAEVIEAWAALARALPTPEEAARNLKANFRRLYRLGLRTAVPAETWRVTTAKACFAVFVRGGVVVDSAPYGKPWAVGQTIDGLTAHVRSRGGTVERLG